MGMIVNGVVALALSAAILAPRSATAQLTGTDPVALVRAGHYDAAIKALSAVPRSDAGWTDAQKWLAITYQIVGKYDDAERVARAALATPKGKDVVNTLGEILMTRGKRAEAESVFVHAVAAHATDSLTAKLNIAILHYERGDHAGALAEFDKFIDVYNSNLPQLTSAELADVAVAVEYLGVRDPQLFKDALTALDHAVGVDPDNIDAKVLLGELFLDKYNGQDAQTTFEEVLRLNPSLPRALVGAAHRLEFDNQPGADSLIAEALKINPEYVPARLALADQLLGAEDFKAAQVEIDHALRIDPTSREALADQAVIKILTSDHPGYDQTKQRALQLNPRDGDFFVAMAEAAARVRQYDDAVDLARQGLAVDSTNWRAYGVLGMNQLRTGQVDSARTNLEISFKGDPYNVWVKNTLDLLDTYKNYDLIKTPHFNFMIGKEESGILGVYLGDLAEDAYKLYSTKYGYTPPPPIRIEVYRSHADFSVRTVGLSGLGALGVSFGTTLAFDSPAAKDAGPFNWGSTVWHELAHTFTLGLTDHRVPRWLSEGLSVYEEHSAGRGWGFQPTPGFLVAFRDGKLPPVSRLNDGFVHPDFPEEVEYAYLEASLVCDFIARDHGPDALVQILLGYKAGQSTDQAFLSVLKVDMKTFDKSFDSYVRERYAGPLASLAPLKDESQAVNESMSSPEIVAKAAQSNGSFVVQMVAGRLLLDRGEDSLAAIPLERARTLFPQYGGVDSPYEGLVKIYTKAKNPAKLISVLQSVTMVNESNYDANVSLSQLLEIAGDFAGAAQSLDRAMYINPFDVQSHVHLAELFEKAGDKLKLIRERRAIVALNPVDRADALYQLALAYESAGDLPNAKKSVLRSLEEAPNFEKAQDLILKLHGGG